MDIRQKHFVDSLNWIWMFFVQKLWNNLCGFYRFLRGLMSCQLLKCTFGPITFHCQDSLNWVPVLRSRALSGSHSVCHRSTVWLCLGFRIKQIRTTRTIRTIFSMSAIRTRRTIGTIGNHRIIRPIGTIETIRTIITVRTIGTIGTINPTGMWASRRLPRALRTSQKALWAHPQNLVTFTHKNTLRLLYIDSYWIDFMNYFF